MRKFMDPCLKQNKILALFFAAALALGSTACSPKQGTDHLSEKAKLEGKAGFEGQIEYQNQRSKEIEKDLDRKFALYSAFEGAYEGMLSSERGIFQVRLSMVPSLSKIKGNRPRTAEEIIYDLNALAMNTQILQWRPDSPQSAIGCMISQIRPDFNRLSISIASENCPSLYKFSVTIENETHEILSSDELFQSIDAGKKVTVIEIQGEIKPNTNARIYPVVLKKVDANENKK
jgi:hypothetical protein